MASKPAAAALWHHFDNLEHQQETTTLGMWVFLATEVLIFGAMFTGYTVYRVQYLASFEAASRHLNLLIGGVNTLVLLTSSLTMVLAVRAAQLGRTKATVTHLVLTAALGTLFLVLKAVEYYVDYRDNLVPTVAFDPAEWTSTAASATASGIVFDSLLLSDRAARHSLNHWNYGGAGAGRSGAARMFFGSLLFPSRNLGLVLALCRPDLDLPAAAVVFGWHTNFILVKPVGPRCRHDCDNDSSHDNG